MKPVCPSCGSKTVLFMKKKNRFWCRICGKEWDKEIVVPKSK